MVRDAIVTGELAPGAVIRDAEKALRRGSVCRGRPSARPWPAWPMTALSKPSRTPGTGSGRSSLREIRDALVVVRAMHELAVRLSVPLMTERHHDRMRSANKRFAAAARGRRGRGRGRGRRLAPRRARCRPGKSGAGRHHRADGLPTIRRLERLRFGSLLGRRSIVWHDQFIDACEDRDVETAVAITTPSGSGRALFEDVRVRRRERPRYDA